MAEPSVADAVGAPFRGRRSVFLLEQESGGTQRGHLALGDLFQGTQNCWEPSWQSKRKYSRSPELLITN